MTPRLLSPHLSVAEYLSTSHRDLARANYDSWDALDSVRHNAEHRLAPLFEDVRTVLGVPLHVSSGYRCAALNAAVGGRPTSRHVLGLAVDLVPVGLDVHAAFRQLVAAKMAAVDEVILELGWLHVQASPPGVEPRRLALVTEDGAHFQEWRA